jgi:hypothetical protein
MRPELPITIRDLYPHMSEAELAVAEANLKRYVAVIVRIYDRLKAEGKSWPDPSPDLTVSGMHLTIAAKGRKFPKKRN